MNYIFLIRNTFFIYVDKAKLEEKYNTREEMCFLGLHKMLFEKNKTEDKEKHTRNHDL